MERQSCRQAMRVHPSTGCFRSCVGDLRPHLMATASAMRATSATSSSQGGLHAIIDSSVARPRQGLQCCLAMPSGRWEPLHVPHVPHTSESRSRAGLGHPRTHQGVLQPPCSSSRPESGAGGKDPQGKGASSSLDASLSPLEQSLGDIAQTITNLFPLWVFLAREEGREIESGPAQKSLVLEPFIHTYF